MKITITAESTIDLPQELLNKYDIKTMPYSIYLGETLCYDGQISTKEIFDFVDKNKILPQTGAINEFQYTEFFENNLKDCDAIIHFALSSEISSACSNAIKASKKFNNVFVVDTKSLSTGIALLAIKARKMAACGKDAKTIYEQLILDREKLQVSFVIDKLDYLKKGGRCSSIMAFGANLLKIHPQIVVKNGKMVSGKKYLGNFESVIKKYVPDTLKEYGNIDNTIAFVTYTTASEESIEFAKNALKNAGFKEVYNTTAGATISSHCGPNTFGILYLTV
ncbi:MAG: DegV family protein [Clostridia bacterium]|nr:DegV family protein [Clostridia bacterium]